MSAGYGIDYRCQRESCGDAQGWALFFPSQVDSRNNAQYYLFARFPEKGLAEKYLTLHVADIGSQPRATIDRVTVLADGPEHVAAYARKMEAQLKSGAMVTPLVAFRFDSAGLDDRSRQILKATNQVLEENDQWTLELVGHADDRGDAHYNRNLSERRAESVRQYLISQGVDGDRLSIRGDGAAAPDGPVTEQWRSFQRRVDLLMGHEPSGKASADNGRRWSLRRGDDAGERS